jgi:taurine---2-oxoglutarate transaminase
MPGRSLFTWSAQEGLEPLRLAGGRGAWFHDEDGRRYLDMASVVFTANAGHNHPLILDTMRAQLDTLAVAGPWMQTSIRQQAAEDLAAITPPGLSRFLFTLGGADANEHAVKIACLVTGRRRVVCRVSSYHGATWGALSFSDDPRTRPFHPALPGVIRVREPICGHCPWGTTPDVCDRPCAQEVETAIREAGADSVAAVLMETVPGTNGGYFPPSDYYRRVREICRRHGALLILDEVLTGFGRTGTWFAADGYGAREGEAPDMMTLGKGITSGHAPLGAVAVSEEIARHFDRHELLTGLTSTAHPVCLAAAVGTLRAFREEELIDRARPLAGLLAGRLEALRGRGVVRDARSRGLYGCLELEIPVAARVRHLALERGVHLLGRGALVFLAPPLVIRPDELQQGMDVVGQVLEGLGSGC